MDVEKLVSEEAKRNAIDLIVMMTVDELAEDMHLNPTELLPKFVVSQTGRLLYEENSKLWWSGPSYIAEMFKAEMKRFDGKLKVAAWQFSAFFLHEGLPRLFRNHYIHRFSLFCAASPLFPAQTKPPVLRCLMFLPA